MTRFLLLLALLAVTAAPAATVTLSNGARCDYGAMSIDAAGNVSVACAATVVVTQPPVPVVPVPPSPVMPAPMGCATTATYNGATFTFTGQKFVFALAPGESAAIGFIPLPNTSPQLATTETVMTPPNADHQVAVSRCPGDFSPAPPCRFDANYIGLSMATSTGAIFGLARFSVCPLQAGVTYYMNVRQVVKGAPQFPSCTQGSCEVRVQIQGLQ